MKRCPNCGNELSFSDLCCPFCKCRIIDYFTIRAFLKDNFQYFVIIGVMGTMISLLPNLGNYIFGPNWISKESFDFFSISLIFIIYFGGLFIFIVFSVIIVKIFEGQTKEKYILLFKKFRWYQGNNHRFILLVFLISMAVGFFLFLVPSIAYVPSHNAIVGFFLVLAVIFVGFLLINYQLGRIQKEQIIKISSYFGKYEVIAAIILAGITIIAFLWFAFSFPPAFLVPHPYSENIKIHPDQLYYSPLVSSEKGLLLEVTNITSDQSLHTLYRWSTNYGYFIYSSISGGNEEILGNKCEILTNRIYWAYPIEDIAQNKDPVSIKLSVVNLKDNSIVTNTSLNFTWFTKDITFVNYSYQ